MGLHDALAAAAFQQGSVLDLNPEEYTESTGGGIPRVLHQVFLDGEEEYARCAACKSISLCSSYMSTEFPVCGFRVLILQPSTSKAMHRKQDPAAQGR